MNGGNSSALLDETKKKISNSLSGIKRSKETREKMSKSKRGAHTYFPSKETKELVPEARLVDIKEIINDPCDKLVNLLIEGPKSEKEEKIIPENTKLNKSYMEDDCVTLDFSAEFLNYDKSDEKTKDKMINSIVNTLTQLTEVNQVKILIDGNTNDEFKDIYSRKITE